MSSLFDKRDDGDEDLKALEARLASARYKPPAVSWEQQAVSRRSRRGWAVALVAIAATLLALVYLRQPKGPSFAVSSAGVSSRLGVGTWLDTKEVATIAMPKLGEVTVEPQSRVRLVESSAQAQRFELERGALYAKVTAPPRLFVVDTPAVKAVDLGCEYRLSIEPSGATRLEVLKGEVSLEGHDATARVSAGAVCVTQPGQPPGVPRSKAATRPFVQALDAWETHAGTLEPVLAAAQRDDAVSLWNMLPRVNEAQRPAVLATLEGVVEEPAKDLSKPDVLKLEGKAMESLWQSFP